MKEIPILFSTQMVQAILEGRKTMTRRILKNQLPIGVHWWQVYARELIYRIIDSKHVSTHCKCPYGQPGDVLWVRETWMINPNIDLWPDEPYYFKASKSQQFIEEWPGYWEPSIHMFKSAARIWLQVEEIRVERLRDITQEDAIAEGIKFSGLFSEYGGVVPHPKVIDHYRWYANPVDAFNNLWIHINGEESFKANPWVWVVKFKVLSTTGKPVTELVGEREAVEPAVEVKPETAKL